MKALISLLAFCILFISAFCQVQNGLVREQNSGNRPVGGVTVRFNDAVPTISDDNGRFRLVFIGKKAGDLISKLEIKKTGYELVNSRELEVIKLSNTDLLGEDIILSKEGAIDATRKEYYGISDRALLASFTKEKKGIEDQLQRAQISQIQYREKYNVLQKQYDLQKQALDSLAEKFARVNFDDVSDLYKEAFGLFKSGKIAEAIQKLEGANLINLSNAILQEEQRIANNKKQVVKGIWLQAQLYVLNLQPGKSEIFYEQALLLDSSNYAVLQDFAEFLRRQNKTGKAILYYSKLLRLTKDDEERATIHNHLGNLCRLQQKNNDAETEFSEALRLFRALNDINRDKYLSQIAWTLNNTGNYYRSIKKWEKAQASFLEALKIFRELNHFSKDAFLPHMALTLNNLGNCYFNQKASYENLLNAKNAYNESLDIYQQLADSNPDAIIPKDIRTFFDLKVNYNDNSKSRYELLREYEIILLKALKTHRQMSEKRPDEFLPFVALTLNNLGNLYSVNYAYEKADSAYLEALKINSDLAIKNYEAFSPFVAATLVSLAKYYRSRNNIMKGEQAYARALAIYQTMNNNSPNTFLPDMACVYIYLGELKSVQRKYDTALYYYDEAFRLGKLNELATNEDFFNDWRQFYINVKRLRGYMPDSILRIRAVKLGSDLDSDAVQKFIPMARKALFSNDPVNSEKALDQLEALDIRPVDAKIIRAHCLLLRGLYKDARGEYMRIKDLHDSRGYLVSKICVDDLTELERAGITNMRIHDIIDRLGK